MSFARMNTDEARLQAEVEALIAQAETADAEEDALYGVGQQPTDLPAELQRREDRLAKIREVRAALQLTCARVRGSEADEVQTFWTTLGPPDASPSRTTTTTTTRTTQLQAS